MEIHIEHRTADCLEEFRGEKFKPKKRKHRVTNLSWKGRTKKNIFNARIKNPFITASSRDYRERN